MRFAPKTEKEIEQGTMLAPGTYDFEVIKSEEKTSSNGNEMIYLLLKVYGGADEEALVHDYLLEAMAHKLRHFAYAVGLGIKYEAGVMNADDCAGRSGKVALRIGQDKAKKYPPKNEVQDYIVPDGYQEQKDAVGAAVMKQGKGVMATAHAAVPDEDIPF